MTKSNVRVKYTTIEFGNIDLHVRTLKDNQQFFDKDDIAKNLGISSALWPLFGIIWPSSKVLANYMLHFDTTSKKVLEVGCGIGLSSLLLNHLDAHITATDYHPEVESFLLKNTHLNDDKKIPFIRADWAEAKNSAFDEYDLIIASDVLYESSCAELLSTFLNQYAKKSCEIIIVDPDRGNHSKFSKEMVGLGFTHTKFKPDTQSYMQEPYKGHIHCYQR